VRFSNFPKHPGADIIGHPLDDRAAANLRARAELMQRSRVSRFSLDALVNIAAAIGRRVHMELESV
jgi:hypothetical protein